MNGDAKPIIDWGKFWPGGPTAERLHYQGFMLLNA